VNESLKAYIAKKGVAGLIAFISVSLSIFQLYTGLFGTLDALMQRSIHLGLALLLVFLSKPTGKDKKERPKVSLFDIIVSIATVFCIGFVFLKYDWITTQRFPLITPLSKVEIIFAIVAIFLVLESTRRIVGLGLVGVVICFLIYPFLGPHLPGILHCARIGITGLLDFQYLGLSGIFGIPLGVSATEVALFIIFASVIAKSGIAILLNRLAIALTGKYKGGPAKIAVVASSLMGTITGSGTANVVTTGSITIPMMKKAGYKPHFAAAVEATASTGGQIMPPVMGAAAFVMSAFTGIPYITITFHAIFPAILYYAALFFMIHFEAVRYNLSGMESEVPLKKTLFAYGHMVIPVMLLVILMIIGYTPRFAAGSATIIAIIMAQLRKTTRMTIADILEALEEGGKGLLMVAVATAAAGIIVGVVDLTAIGQRLGSGLLALSGGKLLPALILTMILAIILGMGMPTTAAYIIQASTVIPALISMGLKPIVAHMFAFYFACLSLITPPVAITAYAAASIANANMWLTGWTAFRLGIVGFIVPFMFVYGPSILLIGTFGEITLTVLTALVGVYALAIGVAGYFLCELTLFERILSIVAAILLIVPSVQFILPGLLLMIALIIIQKKRVKKMKDDTSYGKKRLSYGNTSRYARLNRNT
jgi:TRAP transporter 4TM/12TM fusion protein